MRAHELGAADRCRTRLILAVGTKGPRLFVNRPGASSEVTIFCFSMGWFSLFFPRYVCSDKTMCQGMICTTNRIKSCRCIPRTDFYAFQNTVHQQQKSLRYYKNKTESQTDNIAKDKQIKWSSTPYVRYKTSTILIRFLQYMINKWKSLISGFKLFNSFYNP